MKLERHHWIMILLILFCLGFSIYFPLSRYDLLPDMIPVHFNFAGEPDSWADKGLSALLTGQIIIAVAVMITFPLIWWIASTADPHRIINAPREIIQKMSMERAEEIRRVTVFHILLIMLLSGMLSMFCSLKQVQSVITGIAVPDYVFPVLMVLLLIDAVYFTWKVIRLVFK